MDSPIYIRPTPLNATGVIWIKPPPSSLKQSVHDSSCSAFRPFTKQKKSIRVN